MTAEEGMSLLMRNRPLFGSLVFAGLSAAIVLIGFGRTFFFRPWFQPQPLATLLVFHGVLMATWMVLILMQVTLVRNGRQDVHRKLGWITLALLPALLATGMVVLVNAIARMTGIPPIIGAKIFVAFDGLHLALFGLLATLAILWRDRANAHRPLMLLAAANLLPPALGRLYGLFTEHYVELLVLGTLTALVLLVVVAEIKRSGPRRAVLIGAAGSTLIVTAITFWAQTTMS